MQSNGFLAEEWKGISTLNFVNSRIVRDQVGKYLVESYIVDIMKQIQDAIWPNGVLQKNKPVRSAKEKAKTKRDAGYKLATIFEGLPQMTICLWQNQQEISWAMPMLDQEPRGWRLCVRILI